MAPKASMPQLTVDRAASTWLRLRVTQSATKRSTVTWLSPSDSTPGEKAKRSSSSQVVLCRRSSPAASVSCSWLVR